MRIQPKKTKQNTGCHKVIHTIGNLLGTMGTLNDFNHTAETISHSICAKQVSISSIVQHPVLGGR